jgi:hypothetical protein
MSVTVAPSDLYAAYPDERDFMAALGLRVEGYRRDHEFDHLGTVEFDNGHAVSVSVACRPAQFWRFHVVRPDGTDRVIACNSRAFSYHWQTKVLRGVRGGVPIPRTMVAAAEDALDGNPSGRVVALDDARAWAARGSRGATHLVVQWQGHWFCSCGSSGTEPCEPLGLVRDHDAERIDAALTAYEGGAL